MTMMTRTVFAVAIAGLMVQAGAVELKTDAQKASYAIGVNLGHNIKRSDIDNAIDFNALSSGMQQAFNGEKLALSPEEMQKAVKTFAQAQEQKAKAAIEKIAKENAAQGKAFLEANKSKDGVKTTASGLQYKVLKAGEGASPKKGDSVTVNYEGRLLNGTVFDSSYKRHEPVTFKLDQVIPGWTEGLQLMKKGAKYTFFIPAKLAYGEAGAPPVIAPNSTLVFDVELLGINDKGNAAKK